MRLRQRNLTAQALCNSVASLEIIEAYPDDKYLPSFLLTGKCDGLNFHVLLATDLEGDNVRVVTMYVPDLKEWDLNGQRRRGLK
jgi:hypothetical protein